MLLTNITKRRRLPLLGSFAFDILHALSLICMLKITPPPSLTHSPKHQHKLPGKTLTIFVNFICKLSQTNLTEGLKPVVSFPLTETRVQTSLY